MQRCSWFRTSVVVGLVSLLAVSSASAAELLPPTVATPAAVASNPVAGTSVGVSVLGADDGGEAALTYTWATTAGPTGASFSPNGTNLAKASTVTFTKSGSYTLQCTITDTAARTVTSSVNVTVDQTATSLVVSPTPTSIARMTVASLAGDVRDQFALSMQTQPLLSWTTTGGGSFLPTGNWVVDAAGADIWGTADGFRFVSQELVGDGTIIAKVETLENTNANAKAGVMMRAGTASNAINAFMAVTPTSGVTFQRRKTAGGTTTNNTTTGQAAPRWLRLVRTGDTLTGSSSADGTTWTQVGTDTVVLGATVRVGLALTSHQSGVSAQARFSSVSVTPTTATAGALPTGWSQQDIGYTTPAGTGTYTPSTALYTVQAAGTGVGGTADSFRFAYRSFSGDGTLIARVVVPGGTPAASTAGVMIRDGLTADARQALMAVTAGNSAVFTWRGSVAGASTPTTSTVVATPRWVKLTRSGTTVVGMASADGSSWTTIGSATISFGATLYVGLATTSQVAATATTLSYDNVQIHTGISAAAAPQWPWQTQDIGTVTPAGKAVQATMPGVFLSGTSTGGAYTVTASGSGRSGTGQLTVINGTPVVTINASASPSTVTATTSALSVYGDDDAGQSPLTYTWATTGTPPAPVTFSVNGTNAAKNTTATFAKSGSYTLQVTVKDASNATVTSSVTVTVNQTFTTFTIAPANARVNQGSSQAYIPTCTDQFGLAMVPTPSISWSVTGGGSITTAGVFTAAIGASGPFTVSAVAGSKNASVPMSVNAPPTIVRPAAADSANVYGTNVGLSILGADDSGEAALTYTWATTGTPPASVEFVPNGTNSAKTSSAIFTKVGTYNLQCTITDAGGMSVTSPVSVVVGPIFSDLTIAPPFAAVANGASQTFTVNPIDQFGNPVSIGTVSWAVSGGGTISTAGVFTADANPGSLATVTASVSGKFSAATVFRTGGMTRQWWTGITGTTVATLTANANYPATPTGTAVITLAEAPTNFADNYGTRLQGYVVPPTSGAYRFWIASDDNSELWVSTDEAPANRVLVASVTGNTASREWTKYPSQQSAAITLEAGRRYYVEALHKEGTGGDNLAVGWTLPSSVAEQPIPGSRLQPMLLTANTAPTLAIAASAVMHPTDPTTALLTVLGNDDAGEPNLRYTWSTINTPPATVVFGSPTSNAARRTTARFSAPGTYDFQVVITDAQGLTVTSTASLTVTQTLTSIAVTPTPVSISPLAQKTFTAQLLDQFARPMTAPPAVSWATTGGGSINTTSGLFTASGTAGGPYQVTATASSRVGTAVVTIASDPPVAIAQTLSAAKNTALAITLTGTDPNQDALTYTVVTQPAHGVLSGTVPNLTFTPTTDYLGDDQFTFTVSDGTTTSAAATISLTVYASALVIDASSSPLVKATAFDAARWSADAAYRTSYLAQSVPGRAFQSADPGPNVPVLTPQVPLRQTADVLLPKTLAVRVAPSAPVTFTVLGEGGLGPKMLTSLTVQANSSGIAAVSFSLLNSGNGQIRAASPLASNFVNFLVVTTVTP